LSFYSRMVAARNRRVEPFVWPHEPLLPLGAKSSHLPAKSVVVARKLRSTSARQFLGRKESLKIEGLDLKERHPLAVVDARGKPVKSLWFRFTNYNSIHLCMS
jgi:hypothetical protein